jgi:hypothetical protein
MANQVIWTRHETRPLKRAFRELAVLVMLLTAFGSFILYVLAACSTLAGHGSCAAATLETVEPVLAFVGAMTLFLVVVYLMDVKSLNTDRGIRK